MSARLNDPRLPERFWAKVAVAPNGCWLWCGWKNAEGYGNFKWEQKMQRAYRVAYRVLAAEVPDGFHVDHLCRDPRCCNPAHLEPVPPRENYLRGIGPSAVNARKTECIHGHPFDDENTYRPPGTGVRKCRACNRAAAKRSADRRRGMYVPNRADERGAL